MRIAHIVSQISGGAGAAALRIHNALLSDGFGSTLLVKYRPNPNLDLPTCHEVPASFSLPVRVGLKVRLIKTLDQKRLAHIGEDWYKSDPFTFPNSDYDVTQSEEYQRADIVHLHWVGNFLDWQSFFLKNNKPVLWSLYDLNPFTGGCHYTGGCAAFTDAVGCLSCPQLPSTERSTAAARNLAIKVQALTNRKSSIIYAPASKWLAEQMSIAPICRASNQILLPHLSDEETYFPMSKQNARSKLGFESNTRLLVFVGDTRNYRKGYDLLEAAIAQYSKDWKFLIIGNRGNVSDAQNIQAIGQVNDSETLRLSYNAADAVVIPSREDNLPLTMIDSQMCGTPTICFNVGGLKETVRNWETGVVLGNPSTKNLIRALDLFSQNRDLFDQGNISEIALRKFGTRNVFHHYVETYRKLREQTAERDSN